jgi:hypothetical protein
VSYFVAACYWYPFTGNPPKYMVTSNRVAYLTMQGHLWAAVRALGKSWLEALQDPGWWMQATTTAAAGLLARGSAPALTRLQQTQANLLQQEVARTASVLPESQVFRHTLTADVVPASYARIEQEGVLRLSMGAKAHYGEGVYAWEAGQTKVGTYIDIEVPPGTAVETINANGQTFVRLVPAQGDSLPVKIVGTNLSKEQIELGRQLVGTKN